MDALTTCTCVDRISTHCVAAALDAPCLGQGISLRGWDEPAPARLVEAEHRDEVGLRG
jgi:hypothetical protein